MSCRISVSSNIVCFRAFDLGHAILSVALAEVLSNFSLQVDVVPVHICLDQVHNGPNVTRKAGDVYVFGDNAGHIHGLLLTEFLQSDHLCLDGLRHRNGHLLVLVIVGLHFRNDQLCRFVVPVGGCVRLLVHSNV